MSRGGIFSFLASFCFYQEDRDHHHLESYNEFFDTGLPQLLREKNPIHFFKNQEKIIIDNGGKVTGSISKHTTALILGTKPGSKLVKAKNLNVKIIKEDEFSKIL